ncbi:PEGA domain-containing protein [Polyangium jinanense]|uniref:PEGA domain-containing protein n=1 Tax=Polyangium jinanense TaxID=2829994 RepID=A0A9X3X6Z1_9BACT|nr:PEGA domain-containing protein [Polyangium jinanense]MDC3985044.1 PEGA domain-containing protein [Polyangium jinanense]
MRRCLRSLALFLAASLTTFAARAHAAGEEVEDEARARFEQGVELLQKGAWSDALAAFSTSARLYPTPQAINNAAICLRKLGRYDEALEQVEALLRDFPDLPAEKRQAAEREAAELSKLVGAISVEGAEPGAQIAIDGRDRGFFPAPRPFRVLTGSHLVRVLQEGFLPFETRVEVVAGETTRITVSRQRRVPEAPPAPGPALPAAPPARRFGIELAGAMLIAPSFGGQIMESCTERCDATPALGGYGVLRGSYAIGASLDIGVSAGFLAGHQTLTERRTPLRPPPSAPVGPVDDTLTLSGGLLGIWVGTRLGKQPFLDLRLGAGAMVGRMSDVRSWTANDAESNAAAPFGATSFGGFLYLDPEVRVGVRVGQHLSLAVGVEAMMLLAVAPPAWPEDRTFSDPRYGLFAFRPETLAGPVLFVVLPSLSARYTF